MQNQIEAYSYQRPPSENRNNYGANLVKSYVEFRGDIKADVEANLDRLEVRTERNKKAARLGGLMGYTLRNQVLAVQVGDIRMTGSITHSLLPYLAEKTSFLERFVDKGARCDYIPEAVEMGIAKDPNIAVKGSLILAQKRLERL